MAATLGIGMMLTAGVQTGDACTRVIYKGLDDLIVIGRSLDWKTPIPTNIYVYPAGMEKSGAPGDNAIKWTSRYGAVYAVGYDGGITEGMNEKGLAINGLFCRGTVYDSPEREGKPQISLAMFVGWLLDMNATTDEVVDVLKKGDFGVFGSTFDGGTVSTLHWAITDPSGKTAILEFDHGDIKVYYAGDCRAMTNDPQWPAMTAILDYWTKIGGQHFMPGGVASPDRCVRANYFAHHVKSVAESDLGVMITRSILVASCVPYTYSTEESPELSSTQWRSYSNVRDRTYWFDIVTNPGMYYVDLRECNLRPGAGVMKFDTSRETMAVGNITKKMKKSEPFKPMY